MEDLNYLVYKTTNKVNNKVYIGVHKQLGSEFDGYLGSGNLVSKAIKKYGESNFSRETLYSFTSEVEAYYKETELVNSEFIKLDTNYNMKVGGLGGGEGNLNNLQSTESQNLKIQRYGSITGMLNTPEIQAKAKATCTEKYGSPWGAANTPESKLKELESKVKDAHRKYPELNTLCELIKEGKVEFEGTLYETLVHMYGVRSAVTYRSRLLSKISSGRSFNKRSEWNTYLVRFKLI